MINKITKKYFFKTIKNVKNNQKQFNIFQYFLNAKPFKKIKNILKNIKNCFKWFSIFFDD